jgi:hypothetical protein
MGLAHVRADEHQQEAVLVHWVQQGVAAMIRTLKTLFRRVTPAEVAAKELAEAELALLTAFTHREYAQSLIDYNEARCKRLRSFLAKLEK